MEYGVVCVVRDGIRLMLMQSVNKWDFQIQVSKYCQWNINFNYNLLEPIAYSGDEFGVATGPVVYSDVDCSGWENYLIECQKKNYLEITCSYATVAGVMCADGLCEYLISKK